MNIVIASRRYVSHVRHSTAIRLHFFVQFPSAELRIANCELTSPPSTKIITILGRKFNISHGSVYRENIRRIRLIPPPDCKKHSQPHSNYSPPSTHFPNSSVCPSVRPSIRPRFASPPAKRRIIKTQIETRTIIHEILARGHETKPDLIRPLISPGMPTSQFPTLCVEREGGIA